MHSPGARCAAAAPARPAHLSNSARAKAASGPRSSPSFRRAARSASRYRESACRCSNRDGRPDGRGE